MVLHIPWHWQVEEIEDRSDLGWTLSPTWCVQWTDRCQVTHRPPQCPRHGGFNEERWGVGFCPLSLKSCPVFPCWQSWTVCWPQLVTDMFSHSTSMWSFHGETRTDYRHMVKHLGKNYVMRPLYNMSWPVLSKIKPGRPEDYLPFPT